MGVSRGVSVWVLILAASLAGPRMVTAGYILPGTTGADNKLDLGFFGGGMVLDVSATGTVNLLPQTGYDWITNPDGSVVGIVTDPHYRTYANAGSRLYPTVAGGDGVNHFAGGGANYDTALGTPYGHFGFAGSATTDTTDPGAIRFGAVVYTFRDSPTRGDWHFLGYGQRITLPSGGANLYLAVHDSNNDEFPGVNSGYYTVQVTAVPEPSSFILFAVGLAAAGCCQARRIRRTKRWT